jgi:DNA-directed RNA polymerase subunit N (RpoN/RPB10)
MGNYLNNYKAYRAYKETVDSRYFVDKSLILADICERVSTTQKYICITRPRRFGKSVMANMISAFFSKGYNADDIFDNLKISGYKNYREFISHYDVIFISFNEIPRKCNSYEQYIERIEDRLIKDLIKEYLDADIDEQDALWDALDAVFSAYDGKQFMIRKWMCYLMNL